MLFRSGTTAEQVVFESALDKSVEDWSPDGRWIAYNTQLPQPRLHMLSLETGKSQPYTTERAGAATQARFSPDGKWVVYESTETGRRQVCIQPFPATGVKVQVSTAGGIEPQWRGDGKELFYASAETAEKIMAVDIAVKNDAIQTGIPHPLFPVQLEQINLRNRWLVTPDGNKFLAVVVRERKPFVANLSVIHNWPALLEKR